MGVQSGPVSADTTSVERLEDEAGFGLIELLIAMVVMQVALLALIGSFSAGSVALGRAGKINTAATLADQQMELYRSMPYDAIGLDYAAAPTTGTYVGDTTYCVSDPTYPCGNNPPRNNTGTSTWSCTAASGATSVSTYFSANGINPCVAHRLVSGATTPASPDGRNYYVDSYVYYGTLIAGQRPAKRVSVVVREDTSAKILAVVVSTFDCATGDPTAVVATAVYPC
jgi:Tfp pilus assembly protein PilV